MAATFCGACRTTVRTDEGACRACGAPRPMNGWPADAMIGRLIDGKYRVDSRLSSGGFGTVFIAKQIHANTELGTVVLKFLHSELAHDQRIVKRFVTEARSARELTSPHVVRVFDLGMLEDGVPYMVQEYVVGEGLDSILHSQGPLAIERVIRIGKQISEAMAEAHAKGILHRDLKLENLRVQQTIQGDFVKVLDFGIARVEQGSGTATNSFIGTPRYMAPEQIKQKGVDARADVFALGVILFEILTGLPPIEAETDMEYIHLNLMTAPRDVRTLRAGIPEGLASLVMSMMAKEKSERPAGMHSVYEALDGIVGSSESSTVARLPAPAPTLGRPVTQRTPPPAKTVTGVPSRRIWIFGGAAAGAALLFVVVAVAMSGGSDATPTTTMSPPIATSAPLVATSAPVTSAPVSAVAGSAAPEPETARPRERVRRRRTEKRTVSGPTPGSSRPRTTTTKIND